MIGKSPKYIADQAGHASAGFTLDRYGHLFETITPTPVEWPEDLLWPNGCHAIVTLLAGDSRRGTGEQAIRDHNEPHEDQGLRSHTETGDDKR